MSEVFYYWTAEWPRLVVNEGLLIGDITASQAVVVAVWKQTEHETHYAIREIKAVVTIKHHFFSFSIFSPKD